MTETTDNSNQLPPFPKNKPVRNKIQNKTIDEFNSSLCKLDFLPFDFHFGVILMKVTMSMT